MARPSAVSGNDATELIMIHSRDELDRHVAHIMSISHRKALEAVVEIGMYVLGTFYGGEIERFRSRVHDHRSLDALVEHPAMTMSRTSLYTAVAVAHQVSQLPRDVAYALQPSHHRKLISVRDRARVEELARNAADQGWSVAELGKQIGGGSGRGLGGRSRKAPASRCLDVLQALRSALDGVETLDDAAGPLGESELRNVLEQALEESQEVVRRLRELLVVSRSRTRHSDPPHRAGQGGERK